MLARNEAGTDGKVVMDGREKEASTGAWMRIVVNAEVVLILLDAVTEMLYTRGEMK